MGLEYVRDSGSGVTVEITERLYRTEDGRVVPESDAGRRWLYAVPGQHVPRAEAEKHGLLDEPKERQAPNNKQKRASGTKAKD